jgi:hypothetical protein
MSGVEEALNWIALVFVVVVLLLIGHFTVTDEWRKRGLYVWRTRKPHAFLGLPVVGRHLAYVGMTSSRFHRDQQHLFGTATAPPAPWSDLSPKPYPLPCLFPGWLFARRVQEKLWIFLLFPVYNDQWNHHNPRRITRSYARTLRLRRQAGGRRFNAGLALIRAPFTIGLLLLVMWSWGQNWIT